MSSRRSFLIAIAAVLTAVRAGTSAQNKPSPVATYFKGAEIQAETEQRERQGIAVPNDLSQRPDNIRDRRYADDAGNPNKGSAFLVVKRHVVPAQPTHITEEMLYNDVQRPDVRSAIRDAINAFTRKTSTAQ